MIYDIRLRTKLGSYRSFEFGHIDHDIYLSVFDSQSVKSGNRYTKCSAVDHVTGECPFRIKEGQSQNERKRTVKTEVCERFQDNKCRFGVKCYRKRVC